MRGTEEFSLLPRVHGTQAESWNLRAGIPPGRSARANCSNMIHRFSVDRPVTMAMLLRACDWNMKRDGSLCSEQHVGQTWREGEEGPMVTGQPAPYWLRDLGRLGAKLPLSLIIILFNNRSLTSLLGKRHPKAWPALVPGHEGKCGLLGKKL